MESEGISLHSTIEISFETATNGGFCETNIPIKMCNVPLSVIFGIIRRRISMPIVDDKSRQRKDTDLDLTSGDNCVLIKANKTYTNYRGTSPTKETRRDPKRSSSLGSETLLM